MSQTYLGSAQRTLSLEAAAIEQLQQYLDQHFVQACEYMLHCKGRVVVTGMGKSGHIGNKIAATLASTGTPSFFMHPGEASHGDLGMLTRQDVVLALSNSGETQEVTSLLPLFKRLGVPVISMTGNSESTLAVEAESHLYVGVPREACPLNLAPTSSTTATLAMGDALAIALLEARGFSTEDFAFSHPGGSLGRRLLLKVADIMHTNEQIPVVKGEASLRDALLEMTHKGLGFTCVVDAEHRLLGVYTDGDLRRTLDQDVDFHQLKVSQVMTPEGLTARPDMLAAEVVHLMETHKVNALPVIDHQQRPVGALNMHDLLRAQVI
ncbi:D-arabinose 5-phosphate isomerase [Terasakiispira papahanaumokuakeensis]|uniref:Arabinose 5-phosphate isomerase n=1 Tax=Terasakiispira papahanaumokuakeensis TaxID=197479 RepID=A0A1E2VDT6_9GAMM|nr:KpsF/GutQ family sugar-phosphate isomerase [Terasakiispira papahanaumokuakeensis]ODC05141.1 D-arabinose 5-phosphate isomerase [Terasakiispira papahanaumokuakeensis]